ncbi:predicted protein [Chaetomium globosum CBS 148.51]|uniref:Uncharacterized protein n=1 Tax=Chaetomium globosum (strain ATCC 6205 / CBS 148.51 / DSM 1962 / NBRC 6347 / NRRL 1970) TaxID=306901 RepID=Q2GVD4_CHAGB|nr:uncharacterized protein CHGG_08070 [Chaetomium globosum CBS 148.51]EAQ86817.1 predicted protein [Chaetomium globosum CBS 148.51]
MCLEPSNGGIAGQNGIAGFPSRLEEPNLMIIPEILLVGDQESDTCQPYHRANDFPRLCCIHKHGKSDVHQCKSFQGLASTRNTGLAGRRRRFSCRYRRRRAARRRGGRRGVDLGLCMCALHLEIAAGMGRDPLEPLMLDHGNPAAPSNGAAGRQDGDGLAVGRPE